MTAFSSFQPDKRWAGISLLGVTCEECSSDRFLESYTVWFQKLLTSLQVIIRSFAIAADNSLASFVVFLRFRNISNVVQYRYVKRFGPYANLEMSNITLLI